MSLSQSLISHYLRYLKGGVRLHELAFPWQSVVRSNVVEILITAATMNSRVKKPTEKSEMLHRSATQHSWNDKRPMPAQLRSVCNWEQRGLWSGLPMSVSRPGLWRYGTAFGLRLWFEMVSLYSSHWPEFPIFLPRPHQCWAAPIAAATLASQSRRKVHRVFTVG